MKIKIKGKHIGRDCPVFVIAELSANHNQVFNTAVRTIKAAKNSGADAVKLQTYTPDTMTIDADNKEFLVNHPVWGGQSLYQLYKKAYTPWKWFKRLKKVADDLGIILFSTAFDKSSVDFLEELDVPVHKIASFELVDLPLIEYAARTRKPLILSTGMAAIKEIEEALAAARRGGAKDIILLKCVSSYPANPKEMNLRTIPDMERRFHCPVGLSDHTLGAGTAVAAVSLGAVMIEKHFILSRTINAPDGFFSIEPGELKGLVKDIRTAENSLGKVRYGLTREEKESVVFRRSLFVVKDIKDGEFLTEDNVRSIRPARGLKPKYLKRVIGKKARKDIPRGTPLTWDAIKR